MIMLPPLYQRDLEQLLCLPVHQLVAYGRARQLVYGFRLRSIQIAGGRLVRISVERSGIAIDIWEHGLVMPVRHVG